jgi:two-component system, OmpR family, sensor histidine kinase CiaH
MFNRARLKLALWFAAAMTLTVLVIGLAAYVLISRSLDREIDSSIDTSQATITTDRDRLAGLLDGHGTTPSDDHSSPTAISTDVFFVTTTASGSVIANPRQVDLKGMPFANLIAKVESGDNWQDVTADHSRYRVLTTRIDNHPGGPLYLYIATSLDARDAQLERLALVFGFGGLAAVLLSGFGGLWLAGRALVPIRQALETQRRFVSDASHELRTPIAVVQANNELVLRHADSTVESNLDQLEAIAGETEHMTRLVEDLLTLARADEGRVTVARETLDFGGVVEEVTRDMAALAEIRDVALSGSCDRAEVIGDVQRLRQLIVILVDNALKYTPAGGAVTVSCKRMGRRAELRVADTGPGIAPEHQTRIFDRFFRLDEARKRAAGGSGLGLAIAKWIVEAHHGRITLESTIGKGTAFIVRLPVTE